MIVFFLYGVCDLYLHNSIFVVKVVATPALLNTVTFPASRIPTKLDSVKRRVKEVSGASSTFPTLLMLIIAVELAAVSIRLPETIVASEMAGCPLTVTLPPKMVFKVVDTGPSIKGNSATNVFKDAILENGIKTKVPLFINIGDAVRIDTRTGSYTEKA